MDSLQSFVSSRWRFGELGPSFALCTSRPLRFRTVVVVCAAFGVSFHSFVSASSSIARNEIIE